VEALSLLVFLSWKRRHCSINPQLSLGRHKVWQMRRKQEGDGIMKNASTTTLLKQSQSPFMTTSSVNHGSSISNQSHATKLLLLPQNPIYQPLMHGSMQIWNPCKSIPPDIELPPSHLLPCQLDKPVYTATSRTCADILKQQFSLDPNATMTNTANNRPPHK